MTSKAYIRGFASIPILIFLLVVGALILTQANNSTVARMSGDVTQSDSAAAFFLAETGIQMGTGLLSTALDQTSFNSVCTAIVSKLPANATLGRGNITYGLQGLESDSVTGASKCTFRAIGQVNQAQRTVEKMIRYTQETGLAGFPESNADGSKSVTAPLTVRSSSQAVAVLTSAYRIKGSEGYDAYLSSIGSNSNAESDKACANCTVQWNLQSSTGGPSVGSMTIAQNLNTVTTQATISQYLFTTTGSSTTVAAPRNYVQVGALVTGTSPGLEGVYAALKETTSESANEYSKGTYINGSSKDLSALTATQKAACNDNGGSCACYRSDVLIFAVAGRVEPKDLGSLYSASFDQMTFDTDASGYYGYNVPMELLAHYPNINQATAGAEGDLFAEMWFAYNPLLYATIDKIVTPASTKPISKVEFEITIADKTKDGLPVNGAYIRLFDSCTVGKGGSATSCNFPAKTTIVSNTKLSGSTLRYTIGIPWSGTFDPALFPWATKKMCGGVCALQPSPATAGSRANFIIHRATPSLNQYAGGFLCLSGVGKKPAALLRQLVAGQRWREITSDDQ